MSQGKNSHPPFTTLTSLGSLTDISSLVTFWRELLALLDRGIGLSIVRPPLSFPLPSPSLLPSLPLSLLIGSAARSLRYLGHDP